GRQLSLVTTEQPGGGAPGGPRDATDDTPVHSLRPPAVALAAASPQTGQVEIPDAAQVGGYDLVCFGSPTWFFRTCMPLRSYLKSDNAHKVMDGKHFAAHVLCRRYWSL